MLKLNKKQLQEVIKNELREENGLNEIFKMTLEGLMYLEREVLVSQDSKNKVMIIVPRRVSALEQVLNYQYQEID